MLALAIGGRTVAELKASMSRAEFLAWREFYRRFPFDDRHRYHRPAALVSASMGGRASLAERLEWLEPEPEPPGYSSAELASLRAFGITPPPRRPKT